MHTPQSAWLVAISGLMLTTLLASWFSAVQHRREQLEILVDERSRELQESEGFLRTLIDTLPDLIWLKDPNGIYLSCNRRCERFFGASQTEIVGKTDYDFLPVDKADSFREKDRAAMTAGKACLNEEEITYADDGHPEILETIKTPMWTRQGKLIGVLGIARDITERKRSEEQRCNLEQQLQQSQKLEAVGILAGGVAHDFNNMLGAIIGYAELAMNKLETDDPMRSTFAKILDAAQRSATLTRQLLAFARKQTITPVVFDLNAAVEGTLKMLRRLIGENIELAWRPSKIDCTVRLDPAQLDQILTNLCVNARDAIAGVGKISIKAENVTIDPITAKRYADCTAGEYAQLSISDTGCGMDHETQAHVFEPFFTTKGVGLGTGLGLSTVYGIVKQNHGFIRLYSEPGVGSTFSVHLPRHAPPAASATKTADEVIPHSQGETVLLVEDDPTLREMGELMLQRLGYIVQVAATPGEALRLAAETEADIHLLITDVVMPEMNGRELADRLLAIRPHMRHLFMSGYPADIIAHQGALDQGIHFIQKPFSLKQLAEKIRTVLDPSAPTEHKQ